MLLLIFLVLALLWVVSILPGIALSRQVGPEVQMGPRDDLPAPSSDLIRAQRALSNLLETLPIFLTLAILSIVFDQQGWLSLLGGTAYFVARVLHAVFYLRGISPWRSYAYLMGLLGCLLMALPLLPRLWGA